jgi:hypothetical protein
MRFISSVEEVAHFRIASRTDATQKETHDSEVGQGENTLRPINKLEEKKMRKTIKMIREKRDTKHESRSTPEGLGVKRILGRIQERFQHCFTTRDEVSDTTSMPITTNGLRVERDSSGSESGLSRRHIEKQMKGCKEDREADTTKVRRLSTSRHVSRDYPTQHNL